MLSNLKGASVSICAHLFGPSADIGRVGFAFLSSFSVFVDAAGKPSDGPNSWCVVAGFAATVERWEKFEHEWNCLLRDYDIPYLQMSLLHARKGHFKEEPWKSDRDFVEQFLIRAATIVRTNVQSWNVQCVRWSDFERVATKHPALRTFSNPYGHCASAVCTILQVNCWMLEIPFLPPVEHFMEEGDEGVQFIRKSFKLAGMPEPIVRPGKPHADNPNLRYFVQFQASDWLAFESRKFLKPTSQRIRPSHKALLSGVPGTARRWTHDDLENFCLTKKWRGQMQ